MFILWLAAVMALIFLGAQQATYSAITGHFQQEMTLPVTKNDTLKLSMNQKLLSGRTSKRDDDFVLKIDNQNRPIISCNNVRLIVKSSKISRICENRSLCRWSHPRRGSKKNDQINYHINYSEGWLELDPLLD